MDEIIRKIYRGELCDKMTGLCETLNAKDDKLEEIYLELLKTLTKEQLGLLERYIVLSSEINIEAEETRYVQGFKTGLLLGIECIDGEIDI